MNANLWNELSVALVGGCIGIVVYAVLAWRKRRRRDSTWVPYIVKHGDTVSSIAIGHGISVRLLTEANSLKPPYALVPGTALTVPPDQDGL